MLKAVKAAGLLLLFAAFALAMTPAEEEAALAHKGLREPPVAVTGKPVPPGFAPVQQQQAGGPIWETDAQWDPDFRLTNNSYTDYTSYNGKNVVVDPSGRIHVVWTSYQTPGTYSPQIYYKRYYPGSGWTSDTCISADVATTYYNYYPSIACDSAGNIHVVWRANYSTTNLILYKMCTPTSSGNGGWEAASTVLPTHSTTWYKYYPDVACTPDNHVHVVWNEYYFTAGRMIVYREKIGTTWQAQVMVDSVAYSGYYHGYPSVAGARNNNVHVAWYGSTPTITYYQIFYRGRISGTWGSIENVSNGVYYQYYPSVACNPTTNNPHIVWYGYDPSFYYTKIIHSYRTGSGWQPRDTVSEFPQYTYYQYNPEMVFTADGKGHVVWYGYSLASASYYQIRYNERSAAGVWGTPINLTSVTGSYRYQPSIANGGNSSAPNDLHVVWYDYRDGTGEIYYKHGAPPPPYDVGVSKITVPVGIFEDVALQPACYVKNYGTSAVTGFSVKMDIGTSYSSTVAWSGSLPSGDSVLINTFATWDPPGAGEYPVRCSTRLTSDGNPGNDRLTGTAVIANFVEYFEPTNCGYTQSSSGSNWFWRPPAWPRPAAPSPPNVWTCPDTDYYQNNTAANLYSVTYFAVQDTPRIIFYWWMYCESYWDGGNFSYSTDNGATWTILEPDTTGGRSRPYYGTLSSGERGWSGSYPWNVAWFKIPVANGTPFKCRFRFTSDASVTYVGGMMVDNVAGMGCRKPFDVGATQILAPTGTIPHGTSVTPQAVVKNFGTGSQTFYVRFNIGPFYQSDTQVVNLNPGDSTVVSFANWTADTAGTWATKCSTMLTIDDIPGNDKAQGTVTVHLVDALPTQIVEPGAVVDSGTVITPRARWRNRGENPATFYAYFQIVEAGYSSSRLLVNVPPNTETLVSFNNWTAGRGTYTLRCSTRLIGDMHPENDTLSGSTYGRVLDVAATAILRPAASEYLNDVVVPQATVHNYGSEPATFDLRFVIMDATDAIVYDTTESVTLDVGGSEDHPFTKTWVAGPVVGDYTCFAKATLVGDGNPANDSTGKAFRVVPRYTPGWKELKSVPGTPSGKQVKDGGWLALDPGADNGGVIYAAKGNKTSDFYRYYVADDSWQTLAPIKEGTEARLPKKGCVGIADGQGVVYMTKGSNTLGFWKYYAVGDSWLQAEDVPLGASGKKVKGGTDMVYAVVNDTGYVYLLKGYKTDFFRYNTVTRKWETLPEAPPGAYPKWDKGSWIAIDDDIVWLYAHKAKAHEFYRYDLAGGIWDPVQLKGMPLTGMMGKTKKSKDGGCGAYYDGAIYALKGGNTQEFWCYFVEGDSWQELDTMPAYGSTGKKKRVKAGADIVAYGDGAFFALKGNKTLEFWRYALGAFVATPKPARTGVMGELARSTQPVLSITPNPLTRGLATLRYSLPQAGPVRLVIYDVAGRNRLTKTVVAGRTGAAAIDLRHLARGVYLAKLEAQGCKTTQKLVVE